VDPRKVLDLDRRLALLDSQLLLEGLGIRGIERPQLGFTRDPGTRLLDAEHLLQMIEVPLRNLLLVGQPLGEDLLVEFHPPPRGFLFRGQIFGEVLAVRVLDFLLPVAQTDA
jgi:hypothetical protein